MNIYCKHCGGLFTQTHKNQKYCSDDCKKESSKSYRREYMKKWRKQEWVKKYEKEYKYKYRRTEHGREMHRKYLENWHGPLPTGDRSKPPIRVSYKLYKREYDRSQDRKEYKRKKDLEFIKKHPDLTPVNRKRWGTAIRYLESKKYDYNNGEKFHSHHIYPLILFPDFALKLWNGVPLPVKWHEEFHNQFSKNKYLKHINLDWPELLFDFIEFKIKESNRDLVTLDQWISIES